jgi:DNA-binding transcriptional regulator YiaG
MGSYKPPTTTRLASPIDVHVGQRITHIRSSAGMSRSYLADRLKVPEDDLRAWEMGVKRVPPPHLMTMTNILACPLSTFFERLVADDHHDLGVIID